MTGQKQERLVVFCAFAPLREPNDPALAVPPLVAPVGTRYHFSVAFEVEPAPTSDSPRPPKFPRPRI